MAGYRRRRRKKNHGVLRKIFMSILILGLAAVIAGCVYIYTVEKTAPQISTLDAMPQYYRTTVTDTDGNTVLTLSQEDSNRVYVDLGDVPDDLQHAVIAIEDARFESHHGVDVRGILRAVFRGITNGGMTEGASTITQQLLKNNVFTEWTEETTFRDRLDRKIQEQFLAIALEKKVDKDWILENYLNTINLGGGNWGVQTAATYYFNKDVSELTLSECAVIAGIIKNPTKYNPLKEPEANAERRELVLARMLELGFITEEEEQEALADTEVYERIAEASTAERSVQILNYFEDELVTAVVEDLMTETGCSEEDAWKRIYRGGLTIHSTMDEGVQTALENAALNEELTDGGMQTAMVIIDNASGQIRGIVGGSGEKTASLILDRATDSVRQPGSCIKIIGEYAAGLEDGAITLGSTVADAPHTYSDGTPVNNFDMEYDGNMTVQKAIIESGNIIAVKVFQDLGLNRVWRELQEFGITTLTDGDHVEALALGGMSGGVTPLELTSAYSTLARGGTGITPVYYTTVTDHDGNVILENKTETTQVVSEETATLLTKAMELVMSEGTGKPANFDNMHLAGKSGTTSEDRDAWFVGYSPYYTCGIWVGYDDNSEIDDTNVVKRVWQQAMSEVHDYLEDTEFSYAGGQTYTICSKCGKLATSGLCDSTVGGDTTEEIYFISGTEPASYCDCHVSVRVCRESGQTAGVYCTDTEYRVYLKTADADTKDAAYVLTGYISTSCETHTHFWSEWFDDDSENGESGAESGAESGKTEPEQEDPDDDNGGGWWDSFWG